MNETVLIVEDDESLRTLFGTLLRRHAIAFDCAVNGAEALDLLARKRYDVVVLDLMMPVVNGFDVLRHFSDHDPEMLRRTIVTTGVAERVLRMIEEHEVFAIVRKPFDISALLRTIQSCGAQTRTPEAVHRDAARRFETAAPELRKLLRDASASPEETLLRHELRRVVSELGVAFERAASGTPDAILAYGYTRMARTARQLAGMTTRARRHSH